MRVWLSWSMNAAAPFFALAGIGLSMPYALQESGPRNVVLFGGQWHQTRPHSSGLNALG
jgi:hypothetical protein